MVLSNADSTTTLTPLLLICRSKRGRWIRRRKGSGCASISFCTGNARRLLSTAASRRAANDPPSPTSRHLRTKSRNENLTTDVLAAAACVKLQRRRGSGARPVMPVQPQSRRVENARKPRRSHDHCVGSRSHGRPRRPIHRQPGRVQCRPA